MALYLTISEGSRQDDLRPILATADVRIIHAVLVAIQALLRPRRVTVA